jgi:phytoene dehydrogenase-like protein
MQDEYDVVVVGGGAGGVGAAMGAAREGASVLVVERYGFLGGEATGGLVNTFMPYKLGGENLTNPAFDEIEARLEAAGALTTDETLTPDRKTFDEGSSGL